MNATPIRVLWLCNSALTDADPAVSGTWLNSMARNLLGTNQIELGNIAFGSVTEVTERDHRQVKQWLVPAKHTLRPNGLPPQALLDKIIQACRSFNPDIIHVWGTESFWGLIPTRGLVNTPSVLTLQGILYAIAPHFHGGLTRRERLACFRLRELAKTIILRRESERFLRKWGPFEMEIMAGHRWAICQTPWQEAHMNRNRQNPTLFHLDLPLRKPFELSKPWSPPTGEPTVFCSASHWIPAKGLHVALRAVALLKRQHPNIQLRIGGTQGPTGLLGGGYSSWLPTHIRRLGLENHVHWLGPLDATRIADELTKASVMVIPTFIESYSMAFAETMRVGTPTVVSYTGGTAYLGKDEQSCLFFPPGDEAMCAYQLNRLLSDRELSTRLSQNSQEIAARRHNWEEIAQQQLSIYQQVLREPSVQHSGGVAAGSRGPSSSGVGAALHQKT